MIEHYDIYQMGIVIKLLFIGAANQCINLVYRNLTEKKQINDGITVQKIIILECPNELGFSGFKHSKVHEFFEL